MTRPPWLNAELTMSLAQFRALPAAATNILAAAGARHDHWRDRATGEYGVTIYLPSDTMPRLLAVCRPALEGER